MNGLYIYLLYSTACAYKLEYDFFKFNKKVNNIDRLFFKRFCWITGKYARCTVTIEHRIGKIVSVDNFDDNRWNECSTGIHFFVNKENALNY